MAEKELAAMNKLLRQLDMSLPAAHLLDVPRNANEKPYDPELIYVECRVCGRPVIWEPGRTTNLLADSNISPQSVDEHCLILSDGCRECNPGSDGFSLSMVRLSNFSLSSLMLMQKTKGHA